MKIEELEPFVLAKSITPKHLVMAKGAQVKWLVCYTYNKVIGKIKLVVYDIKGWAYESEYIGDIDEEFFEKINIRRFSEEDAVFVNGIKCKYYGRLDYKPAWRGHENSI